MPVDLRPLTRDDYWMLSGWLREPLVRRWWADDPSLSALEEQYGGSIDGTDPTHVLVASEDGTPFGLIQWYRYADEPGYVAELGGAVELPEGAASIDYLIGTPEARGRGLGGAMVAAVLPAIGESGATALVVPVHADNVGSWRMLERSGFRRVAEADLEPDNPDDDRRHVVYRLELPGSDAGLDESHRRHLRRCVELAGEALEAGDFPFGSILVGADGRVLVERRNTERTGGSALGHPELDLAGWAAHHLTGEERAAATAYTSGEHCAMCSAAHGWVGLGPIVYAASSAQLDGWRAEWGAGPSPVRTQPVGSVVPDVTVLGPDPQLAEQMRALHERAFWRDLPEKP